MILFACQRCSWVGPVPDQSYPDFNARINDKPELTCPECNRKKQMGKVKRLTLAEALPHLKRFQDN